MVFGSRIGSFLRGAVNRIGSLDVHGALNRIGQIASVGHKLGSLINHTTGGGLKMAADAYLGKGVSGAIGAGVGYASKMYDQSLVAKAVLNSPSPAGGASPYGGGSLSYGRGPLAGPKTM